jgi:hypothetical protein
MPTSIKKTREDWKLDEIYKSLDRNMHWISHADNKASILIAVISIIYAGNVFLNEITSVINSTNNPVMGLLISSLSLVYGFTFLGSIIFLILVLVSRVKNSDVQSLVFFENIKRNSLEEFKKSYLELKEEDLHNQLLNQVYITSQIASRKHGFLNIGYICIILSFSALILLSVILHFVN